MLQAHWFFKNINLFYFLFFMAVLDLCCCVWAFSSFREWRLHSSHGLQASHGGFSCGAQYLECVGSAVAAFRLSCLTAGGILVLEPGIEPITLH